MRHTRGDGDLSLALGDVIHGAVVVEGGRLRRAHQGHREQVRGHLLQVILVADESAGEVGREQIVQRHGAATARELLEGLWRDDSAV